ncbi:NACHT domain-containing protein [Allokutzneria sp. A3M-2-11 16]|uniref:NACHT domain-containing protein n=1 Tax=Allokutzneria sp. A3M-2-11 16 TaxID=2962043 RepID=UPI0020B89B73|nr:NACHT domain-containing protein [Allokutzneria sp. A3M-2-11 16]MCP3803240.1 NACHT domain-containing protein [Allokutzneria sp. A3M-2-11 16]
METEALKLGTKVATHAAKSWLQRRKARFERGASLAELAQAELKGVLQRRKLENLVDRIGQQVAEQLAPVLEQRFSDLPANEAEAAVLAVVDVLEDVDLSDSALLSADADAEVLAQRIRTQFPKRAALLTPRAEELHELALDQACRHLVQVVRYLPSFQPAALVEVLARLTAQSEQLDLLLSRVPTTSLYAPRGVDRDEDFRVEYLAKLATKLDRLDLLGLPGDEQPRLALTVAYLSLSVSGSIERTKRRRLQPERWFDPQAQGSGDTDGIPVEAAIGSEARVLLRGDAGSGKTTLLHWLAVRAARAQLSGALAKWNDCVPFVILLRTFAEGDLPAPQHFVAQSAPMIAEIMPEGWVHRLLQAGRAMVLVDGVDEVPAARRRVVKTWLGDLLTAFPDTRVVVTARTAAADSRWLAEEEFRAVTLEPMNPSNILEFVQRWHHAAELSGAEVADAEHRLRSQLERPHLRQLAASPLLCAMLCALNLSHRSELPRNRMDLYAKAFAMLLHLRDAERGIPALLSDTEKRVLLRDLAWRLTLANKVELPASEALGHITRKLTGIPNADIDAMVIFKHLLERSCVLRDPVPGRVDFVHRTFLEYLAAEEAIQQHHLGTLIAHAHQDTWWETFVMAAGHATTTQATQLLTGILDRAEEQPTKARHLRLLAAACLETVRDIAPEVSARVDAIVREKLIPPRRMKETRSLMSIGHRILRYLPDSLEDLSTAKAAATVRAAALAGTTDALPLLASYAQDRRPEVHHQLETAWHYFDPERFAEVVLANSPLHNGQWVVRSRIHLPYVRHLRALTSLHIEMDVHEEAEGLEVFAGLPAVETLMVKLRGDVPHDLRLLTEHRRLARLWLQGLQATEDLSPLANLPALMDVGLTNYRDEALSGLPELNGVIALFLFQPEGAGLEHAARVFRSAKGLILGNFSPLNLVTVAQMTSIEHLWIQVSEFDEIAPLRRLTKLSTLAISTGVKFNNDLSPLSVLDLSHVVLDRDITYTGIEGLKGDVRRT